MPSEADRECSTGPTVPPGYQLPTCQCSEFFSIIFGRGNSCWVGKEMRKLFLTNPVVMQGCGMLVIDWSTTLRPRCIWFNISKLLFPN